MRSPRSRSSINLYQRETVLCSWLGPRPVLSPQRARGQPSGSEREDEEAARPSVLGKHGPQSPASASAQQRAKKVKPAARKKDEKEKNSKKKKNKAKPREKSASPSQSSSDSQG